MRGSDCLSDLVTRARRYRLSRAEQSQLDEHLSQCASCRLQQQVGADFDAIGGLRAGDDVLIAQLADRATRRPRARGGGRSRLRSLSMTAAAACALFAAAAGATVLIGERAALVPQRTPRSLPAQAQPATHEQTELGASVTPRAPRTEAQGRGSPARRTHAAPLAQVRSHADTPEASVESAYSLFLSANNERRHNRIAAAISLYNELEQRYPESEEARVSRVSLGRLLLARGMPAEGLSQLNDYLTTSKEGMLAPEALFGKGLALETLGRRDEERTVWNRLLAKFPDSVYAAQARRRIEELR
jgi:TolA-binding protein